MKNTKGITLVLLIITIIVILILAGISLYITMGEEGILFQTYNAKEKYEESKIEEENEIVQNEDIINNILYENENSILPKEYQQVEYIETTVLDDVVKNDDEYTYIDTGVKLNFNSGIELKAVCEANSAGRFFKSGTYGVSNQLFIQLEYQEGRIGYYNKIGSYSWDKTYFINLPATFEISMKKRNLTINGKEIYNGQLSYGECNTNCNILFGNYKYYYFKIYDGDTLIRDFIPCYRKSDNKPGMYDTVNNVFYTNKGAGEFRVGNKINIKK